MLAALWQVKSHQETQGDELTLQVTLGSTGPDTMIAHIRLHTGVLEVQSLVVRAMQGCLFKANGLPGAAFTCGRS